jgi:hypothetical protein
MSSVGDEGEASAGDNGVRLLQLQHPITKAIPGQILWKASVWISWMK